MTPSQLLPYHSGPQAGMPSAGPGAGRSQTRTHESGQGTAITSMAQGPAGGEDSSVGRAATWWRPGPCPPKERPALSATRGRGTQAARPVTGRLAAAAAASSGRSAAGRAWPRPFEGTAERRQCTFLFAHPGETSEAGLSLRLTATQSPGGFTQYWLYRGVQMQRPASFHLCRATSSTLCSASTSVL